MSENPEKKGYPPDREISDEDLYEAMTDTPIRGRPGRSEPRCRKRRQKNYELMTRPRREMKEISHRNRYRA